MTQEGDFVGRLVHLSTADALAAHVKRMMREMTGLSEEEVSVDVDSLGNVNVTCKPKAEMKTVEMEIVLGGEEA